jgi:addiction module HigA family antidote
MPIPTHPGELLKQELGARKMSARDLAKALGVDAPRINDIVRCKRRITADTALRLAQYFGGEAKF